MKLPSKYYYRVDPITRMFREVIKDRVFSLKIDEDGNWSAEIQIPNPDAKYSGFRGIHPKDPIVAIHNLLEVMSNNG